VATRTDRSRALRHEVTLRAATEGRELATNQRAARVEVLKLDDWPFAQRAGGSSASTVLPS
jgi:hypothetical protein